MNVVLNSSERALVSLSRDELLAMNNALNEICNGLHIDDRDFETRVGINRSAVAELLAEVGAALDASAATPEVAHVWSESGAVMVKAITVFGDPVELGEREAAAFAGDLTRAREDAS